MLIAMKNRQRMKQMHTTWAGALGWTGATIYSICCYKACKIYTAEHCRNSTFELAPQSIFKDFSNKYVLHIVNSWEHTDKVGKIMSSHTKCSKRNLAQSQLTNKRASNKSIVFYLKLLWWGVHSFTPKPLCDYGKVTTVNPKEQSCCPFQCIHRVKKDIFDTELRGLCTQEKANWVFYAV